MNNTKKRQIEIAKNMLEVQIDMNDIVEISGLTLEEVQKLSKTVQVRVRETQDVVNFDLKDTLYHYDDKAVRVGDDGKVVIDPRLQNELEEADLAEKEDTNEPELVNVEKVEEEKTISSEQE